MNSPWKYVNIKRCQYYNISQKQTSSSWRTSLWFLFFPLRINNFENRSGIVNCWNALWHAVASVDLNPYRCSRNGGEIANWSKNKYVVYYFGASYRCDTLCFSPERVYFKLMSRAEKFILYKGENLFTLKIFSCCVSTLFQRGVFWKRTCVQKA